MEGKKGVEGIECRTESGSGYKTVTGVYIEK